MPDETVNGHNSDDLPEIQSTPVTAASSDSVPTTKGVFIQPFPGGGGHDPVRDFMRASNKPEEFLPLTRVDDWEISRDERILYFQNVANYGNGKLSDVMMFGYNLRRARNGQTAADVVQMISGRRQQEQQSWRERSNRWFNRSRGASGNPLNNASDMASSE